MSIEQILLQVASYKPRYVCVTGGEPLAQPNALMLLQQLCDAGYEVSLETSGALDVAQVDARVSRVVDLKTPGSLEVSRNRYANLAVLGRHDQVKFVICSREDYEWSRFKLDEYALAERVGELAPRQLAEWIVADNLPVRFQMQLHKYLWNDELGH